MDALVRFLDGRKIGVVDGELRWDNRGYPDRLTDEEVEALVSLLTTALDVGPFIFTTIDWPGMDY